MILSSCIWSSFASFVMVRITQYLQRIISKIISVNKKNSHFSEQSRNFTILNCNSNLQTSDTNKTYKWFDLNAICAVGIKGQIGRTFDWGLWECLRKYLEGTSWHQTIQQFGKWVLIGTSNGIKKRKKKNKFFCVYFVYFSWILLYLLLIHTYEKQTDFYARFQCSSWFFDLLHPI